MRRLNSLLGAASLLLGLAACDPGAGTGLLIARLSADPVRPPSPGNTVVLNGTGSIQRSVVASFPPAGPGPLIVEYPGLPAGTRIDVTVQTFDSAGCVVGETDAPVPVTLRGGAKTSVDLTIRRATSSCGDGGLGDGVVPDGEAGAAERADLRESGEASSDGSAFETSEVEIRNDARNDIPEVEDAPELRDAEDVAPSDDAQVIRDERDDSVRDLGAMSLPEVLLVAADGANDTAQQPADVVVEARADLPDSEADSPVGAEDCRDALDEPGVDCGPPPGTQNGSVVVSSTKVGGRATYSCSTGYGASGVLSRVCQSDGTWSGSVPICVPVHCGALVAPENGAVDVSSETYPSTATYSCLVGFTLVGHATRACQADGTWSGSVPTCAPNCKPLADPANGTVSAPDTKYGATATYACLTGFELSGTRTRTCQATGEWSDSAPTCLCPSGTTACAGACVDTQTSPDHCGTCGSPCTAASPSTALCTKGRCLVTLAAGQSYPGSVAVDATSAYWTTSTTGHGGNVKKVPLAGGTPSTYASPSGAFGPNGALSIDARNVYWATDNPAIVMAPLDGLSSGRVIARCCNQPRGMSASGGYVYWGDSSGSVMRVTTDGTDLTQQVSPSLSTTPTGVTVTDGIAFWASSDGNIMRMSVDNMASLTSMGVGDSSAGAIAVDSSSVYWTIPMTGKVVKTARDGSASTAPIVLASGQAYPQGIGVDSTRVYWTNSQDGTVMSVPVAGGSPTPLVSGQSSPGSLVVSGTGIYWINQGSSGSVMRLDNR